MAPGRDGFRFLSLVRPFMSVLPEVVQPDRRVPFRYVRTLPAWAVWGLGFGEEGLGFRYVRTLPAWAVGGLSRSAAFVGSYAPVCLSVGVLSVPLGHPWRSVSPVTHAPHLGPLWPLCSSLPGTAMRKKKKQRPTVTREAGEQ
jgi:hypothetical protein